ncbi:MAG: 2,5-diamino-6-(ribosylamino)-4(3H)-pyrimidinone 5'-phosphate reductase [Candidatus Hadarchaeales archaeon]
MDRPHVILNAATTADGKIATVGGDSKISCREDLKRLHRLRSKVDAVMVGAGTVIADDPALTVRFVKGKNPIRVVVDGEGRIPLHARILSKEAPTIVAVSEKAEKKKLKRLREKGAEIIVIGKNEVDLGKLLETLKRKGVKKLLLEGGSTLNWNMLANGLVDEIIISIAPVIVGGEKSKSLVGGAGFERVAEGIRLRLRKVERVGRDLTLYYTVEGRECSEK